MKEKIKQKKACYIRNVQKNATQRRVKAILQDRNGNQAEGISTGPKYDRDQPYFDNASRISKWCPPLYNLFCKNVIPKDVGEQKQRPIWQCAEPHALDKYIFTYSSILNTDNLKSLHFTSIKDDRGVDGGKEYDVKPCAVCEQWIDSNLSIRENIIPQGLKNKFELKADAEKKAMIESEKRANDSLKHKFSWISFLENCTREEGQWIIPKEHNIVEKQHIQQLLATCEKYYNSSQENIDDMSFCIQRYDAEIIVESFLAAVK